VTNAPIFILIAGIRFESRLGDLPVSNSNGLRNIRNYPQFVEKLCYIHRNLVKRGLCGPPKSWEWSSFAITQPAAERRVEVESKWTA
jgi:hypothetical protein